jgi:pimeloyl-ACP methyl ester carboxylesterase
MSEGKLLQPLYTKTLGSSGPTMVFLHGVGGTSRYWESRVAPLAAHCQLLLVDLLGFGRSPKPWRPRYTVELHVAELHRTLRGRAHVSLVGHSFGAILAAAYAARYPEQVDSLVMVSLPYFGGEEAALRHFRGHAGADRWWMTNIVLAAMTNLATRYVLRRVLPALFTDMPRDVVEDLTAHTWRSSTSTIWEGVYRYDSTSDFRRIRPELPVLLVHGDQDATAPIARVLELARLHPAWKLDVRKGVDHHPLLRETPDCVASIAAFAADVSETELVSA